MTHALRVVEQVYLERLWMALKNAQRRLRRREQSLVAQPPRHSMESAGHAKDQFRHGLEHIFTPHPLHRKPLQ